MADFVFNVAAGKGGQLIQNVEDNSPTGCELVLLVINTSATDATLQTYDTVSALLGDANTAEVTNTNYARVDRVAANITIADPDTNDRFDVTLTAEVTWSSVAAGDAWTDLVLAYDPTGSSADTALIPISLHDFSVTPNGGDITTSGLTTAIYRATATI